MLKFTQKEVDQIRKTRCTEWVSQSELAGIYGVSESTVSKVLRNVIYPDPSYDPEDQVPRPSVLWDKLRSDTGVPYEVPQTATPYVIYGLYCICERCEREIPRLIRYVGQARRGLPHRMSSHFTQLEKEGGFAVTNWKMSHGRQNIRPKVLEVLETPDELNDAEIRHIREQGTLRGTSPHGLNLTPGGNQGWYMSPEARERLRIERSGENSRFAVLNWDSVKEIRRRVSQGERGSDIARSLSDISEGTIHSIIRNATWVDESYTPPKTRSRVPKGDERPESKLTWEQVGYIRENHEKEAECAKRFGVSRSLINMVRMNRIWVDEAYTYRPKTHPVKRAEGHANSKLNWDKVRSIRSASGTYKKIADEFGVSSSLIMGIKLNRMWSDPEYDPPTPRGWGGRKKRNTIE